VTLRAYIDDSGSDGKGPIFVLGGFVAPVGRWLAFSDEWKAALTQPPALEYFKMKEAARLRDQFDPRKGWTPDLRDRRINDLSDIIHKYASFRLSGMIRHRDFNNYIKSVPAPERGLVTDTPYVFLFMLMNIAIAYASEEHRIAEPVDFICDNQEGMEEEIAHYWAMNGSLWEGNLYRPARELVFKTLPIFRNDREFLPLQAADLYAWQMRRSWINNQHLYVVPNHTLRKLLTIPSIDRFYTEEFVKEVGKGLLNTSRRGAAANPEQKFQPPIADPREQKKNRRKARVKRRKR
jgi:hypothetical protein